MSDPVNPSALVADLSGDRLEVVAETMLEVLADALAVTNTPLDCSYSRAVLAWARIKNALLKMARSASYDWLALRHSGNDLVIAIGSVPVRFFIDDHSKPKKRRVLSPTEAEAHQLTFDGMGFTAGQGDLPTLWRFIIERAVVEDDENRVYFVGYDALGNILAKWQFTESVRAFHSTDNAIPAAAELDPVSLAPIYGAMDDEDDFAEHNVPPKTEEEVARNEWSAG